MTRSIARYLCDSCASCFITTTWGKRLRIFFLLSDGFSESSQIPGLGHVNRLCEKSSIFTHSSSALQTDGQTDRQTDGQTDKQTDRRTDGKAMSIMQRTKKSSLKTRYFPINWKNFMCQRMH